MHELRLLNPDGYLALHPQARTVVPAEETAAARHHLLTVVAPADAAAPVNQGAGYRPYAYRVQTTPLPEETPVAELNFHLFHPDEPGDANLDDGTCNCEKPDNRYVMEIEEGQVNLKHAACGKSPNWGDWQDLVFASSMPVRVEYDSDCSGSHMHSHTFGCDCDYWFQITEVMGTTVGAEENETPQAAPSEVEAEVRSLDLLALMPDKPAAVISGHLAALLDELDRVRAERTENQRLRAETSGPICTTTAARAAGLDIAPAPAELSAMAETIVAAAQGAPTPEVDLARAVPLMLEALATAQRERDAFRDQRNGVFETNERLLAEREEAQTARLRAENEVRQALRERDALWKHVGKLVAGWKQASTEHQKFAESKVMAESPGMADKQEGRSSQLLDCADELADVLNGEDPDDWEHGIGLDVLDRSERAESGTAS